MNARTTAPILRALLTCAALVTTAGCASLTPQQAAELRFQRDLHEAKFVAYRNRCFAMGGKIYINAHGAPGRGQVPNRGERYFCG